MTTWGDHAILWQVYPLGFTGAERTALPDGEPARHRLRKLEPWLDYAVELGCKGLLLGPIFASESHGYDTTDHFRIDSRLGDEADFEALVAAADRLALNHARLVAERLQSFIWQSLADPIVLGGPPRIRKAKKGGQT